MCAVPLCSFDLQNMQVVWQWLENVHGRWCSFSSDVMQRIERAYRNGDPLVRVFSGRHRHVIQFSSMLQVSFKNLLFLPKKIVLTRRVLNG